MSKPRDWYDMTDEQRRAWQRQENERSEMEYEKERAERDAKRAEAQADHLRRELRATQQEDAEALSAANELNVELHDQLDIVTVELMQLKDRLKEHCDDLEHLWSAPANPPTLEHVRGIIALFRGILTDPS